MAQLRVTRDRFILVVGKCLHFLAKSTTLSIKDVDKALLDVAFEYFKVLLAHGLRTLKPPLGRGRSRKRADHHLVTFLSAFETSTQAIIFFDNFCAARYG